MSGDKELFKSSQQDQQGNENRDQEKQKIGGGGGGPSFPRSEAPTEATPNIHFPENMSPQGLVEVVMEKGKWLDALTRINGNPLKLTSIPRSMKSQLQLAPDTAFVAAVTPMSADLNSSGDVRRLPLCIDLGVEDPTGKTGTYIPQTTEAANRKAATRHLVKILGEAMGWRKLDDRTNPISGTTKQFETGSGNVVTLKNYITTTQLIYSNIEQSNLEATLEEVRRLIEISADFSTQLFAPPDQEKKRMDIPYPLVKEHDMQDITRLSKAHKEEKKNDGEKPKAENGMVSGFNIEDHRVGVSGYSLEDLGGNPEVKAEIEGLLELFGNPNHFLRYGKAARPPRGILLEGPPGTGKTLTAQIIASSLGIPFYELSVADLKNVWVGESPKIVKSAFTDVEKPSVLFFDEFDAIGRSREELSPVERDIMQELLRGMQGLDPKSGIIAMAATNNAELLDKALIRPGRFDRKIHVGLPTAEGRQEIFKIHYKKALQDVEPGIQVFSRELADQDFQQLAELTDGFSGAEIAEIYRRTVFNLARKALKDPSATASENDLQQYIEQIRKEKIERQKTNPIGFMPSSST